MTYQDLTQQVLQEIRSGVIPWRKPWANQTSQRRTKTFFGHDGSHMPPLNTYTVRVEYTNGMERLDLTAKDRIDLLTHLAKLLRMEERMGCDKSNLVSVTIERE